ncbi:sugar-binding transcriptional regulator [Vagococcus humatus]|nr:sugar-binding transcriptional regulator [Vagococcus humatus]
MDTGHKKKVKQAIQVAKYYYESNLDQSTIAKEMQLSRPTVSRLLQYAKDEGFVQIEILDPFEDTLKLEETLAQRYHLKKVIITYAHSTDEYNILQNLGYKTANYLQSIVKDGDLIGVGFGKTIYSVATQLTDTPLNHVKIVQLKGGESHSSITNYSHEVMSLFSQAFHGEAEILPLPVIFDYQEIKELVMKDRHIQYIMNQGKKSNIAVFTVGSVHEESMLFHLNYFSQDEIAFFKKEAVGDIFSRFITASGEIANPEINRRTIGIDLDELKEKKDTILVAGGSRKVPAIHGALVGGYANTLIIDAHSAKELLQRF